MYHSNSSESVSGSALLKELENTKARLNREANVEMTTSVVNNDTLTEGVASLVKQYQASLIVMGITGRNKVGQKLIGSNVFQVSQKADVPVLIIPAKARFTKIENVALALPDL